MRGTPDNKHVYIALCILFWGLWAFLPKLASRYMGELDVFVCEVCAIIVIAGVIMAACRPKLEIGRSAGYGLAAGAVGTLGFLLYVFAVAGKDASVVASLTALYPVVPVLLGVLVLKERLSAANWAGILLALCAVALLSG